MRDDTGDVRFDPSLVSFAMFSAEDIRQMSVAKVYSSKVMDDLGNGQPGGPYDPAMGPVGVRSDPCTTCLRHYDNCPGHLGHIDLCFPIFNPMFLSAAVKLLRVACLECHKIQIKDHVKIVLELQFRLLDAGYVTEAQEIEMFKSLNAVQGAPAFIKQENGINLHPKLAEYTEMLMKEPENVLKPNTKTIRLMRIALVNSALVKNPTIKSCVFCQKPMKRIKISYGKLVFSLLKNEITSFYNRANNESAVADENDEGVSGKLNGQKQTSTGNQPILADECRQYLRDLYTKEGDLLRLLYPILDVAPKNLTFPVDIFFMDVVPVVPPNVRPVNFVNGLQHAHSQTKLYQAIVDANNSLRIAINPKIDDLEADSVRFKLTKAVLDKMRGNTTYEKVYHAWEVLQTLVNRTLDASSSSDRTIFGLKQIIEKKEGIIRMHMMGKRVNYAARTVITPDPNVNVDEIGIPESFAKILTYPVPVTPWNIDKLKQLIVNGPNIYPGANYIQNPRGIRILIPPNDEARRKHLADELSLPDVSGMHLVHRHVQKNDMLLLNRQPTLHRNSIMAHKARILKKERTFRLHYSNCKAYNADFDGDEMNAHLPQNELGRSEAYNLVNVSSQYLVPKDGSPLGGLIQDHIIAGVKLSLRGRFFNREDYQQLVYRGVSTVSGMIKLLPPAIVKPIQLWSGKQILSTIILNAIPRSRVPINLTSKAKINAKAWQACPERSWMGGGTPCVGNEMTEAEVIIRCGELLVGIFDKTHYGPTRYGFIHAIYELYGGDCASRILSSFANVFTAFLQREGFSLGVRDILVRSRADNKRDEIVKRSRLIGNAATAAALELHTDTPPEEIARRREQEYLKNPNFQTVLDRKYKSMLDSITNEINRTCIPNGLISKFPHNNLQLMVESGAKGSSVNTMQISSLLGQIELEGKRPPLMFSGKSLPSFATFETSPKSGGFIDSRFMTGIQPQDFFFHCMAGREGLIDTAVKTSRSGYLQRCLIKHLEGLSIAYDMTVRDSDNSVIQFMYGEDGMDVMKSQYFVPAQMSFIDDNEAVIVDNEQMQLADNSPEINKTMKKYTKKLKLWCKQNGSTLDKHRVSSFKQFSLDVSGEMQVKNGNKIRSHSGRTKLTENILKAWYQIDNDEKEKFNKKYTTCPDPINTVFKPDVYFGSVSENTNKLIAGYLKTKPDRKRAFTKLMHLRSIAALAPPGEPVGILAAQSIGEPSTQMTLNTFHFAGRGEMNVTLGIPRLREILMLASFKIKTPSLDIPFRSHINVDSPEAQRVQIRMNRVTVQDVLASIDLESYLVVTPQRVRRYNVRFNFLAHDAYKNQFCVKPKKVLSHMNRLYFKFMLKALFKAAKEKVKVVHVDVETKSSKATNLENTMIDEQEPSGIERNVNKEESSDDEMVGDDEDATAARLKSKRADERDYDEPDVKEEIDDANDVVDENEIDGERDTDDDDVEIDNDSERNEYVRNYRYDKESHLWCEITFDLSVKYKNMDLSSIMRQCAARSIIWEVPKITRAITYAQDETLMLKTEGINIAAMMKHDDVLDLNRLYSNDIHAIAVVYGIEAANRVIVKEIQNVFKVYGITVNPRHLLLIADYMTFDGTFKPLSRKGMEASASPLQQMSFESSLKFLQMAAVAGNTDHLASPSSRLMVGQPCSSGTGSFQLINDCSKIFKNLKHSIEID